MTVAGDRQRRQREVRSPAACSVQVTDVADVLQPLRGAQLLRGPAPVLQVQVASTGIGMSLGFVEPCRSRVLTIVFGHVLLDHYYLPAEPSEPGSGLAGREAQDFWKARYRIHIFYVSYDSLEYILYESREVLYYARYGHG